MQNFSCAIFQGTPPSAGRSRASSSMPPPARSVPSGPAADSAFGTNIAMNAFMLVENSGVITSRAEGNKDLN